MNAAARAGPLERGLDLVLQVADSGPNDARAIAQRAGLPVSTTYRLLNTLTRKGFLRRSGDGSFGVGWAVDDLANLAASAETLPARSQPILRELSEQLGETAFLAIRNGRQFVIVGKSEASQELRTSFPLGTHLPLERGALGGVFLAFDGDDPAFQPVRHRGFATSDGEASPGVRAVAAPVFDHTGAVVSALSVAGPAPRFSFDEDTIVPVLAAAARLSRLLGHNQAAVKETA